MSLESKIKANVEELIEATKDIISIKSVKEEPLPGMPFGEGPAKALEYVLNLADSFGMRTKNLDNYAGWAEWGEGDELIGVLVHLDVVPEGSGWTYPPYGGEIHDGKIYGRGTTDDKGPAMAALFALKSLKDAKVKFNRRVRIIFGTDEESGSECMKYYIAHDEIPTMGFSPDANYPIINSEKGILTFTLKTDFDTSKDEGIHIVSFKGGERPNMVPDYAECTISGDSSIVRDKVENLNKKKEYGLEYDFKEGQSIVKSYGVSAHGSTPAKGKNAIMQLMELFEELEVTSSQRGFIKFLNENIGTDTTGRKLGIDFSDDISGHLTLNVGVAKIDQNTGNITVNIRYPIKSDGEVILEKIKNCAQDTIRIEDITDSKPHYVPEDNPMIQKLKKAYEKVTGQEAYCFSIGGGTYARMFKNCVAFGPTFPGGPELAHEKDEYMKLEDLIKNLEIYSYVLEELVQ